MRSSLLARRWLGGCWGLLLSVGVAAAQEAAPLPPGSDNLTPLPMQAPAPAPFPPPQGSVSLCRMAAPGCQAPKVVVHLPAPEVVYKDEATDGCQEKERKPCRLFRRRHEAPATVTVASILSPMGLVASGGFVGQAVGSGITAQGLGLQDNDLAEMRAAHEMELMAARLKTIQAAREAEAQIRSAHLQRVQAHLSSVLPNLTATMGGTGSRSTVAQGVSEPSNQKLAEDIQELNRRVSRLEQRIEQCSAAAATQRREQMNKAVRELAEADKDLYLHPDDKEKEKRFLEAVKKVKDLNID